MPAKPLPRILLLSLIALALLWAGALALLARAGRPADAFASADKIDFRLSARPGMNLRPEDLAPGALGPALDRLSAAGVRFVRFTLPWDEIEPARGAYLWDKWDEVAAAFAARPDLQPVVVLDRSPEWARRPEDAGNPLAPPQERRDFGAFARAAAERYGEVYTYFQPWDEPNIAPHWGARPADPVDYAGLLREAAINIRAADGNARILAAALAPTIEEGPANLSDITYLDRLYAAGGREWFDYPAAQLYGFSDPPGAAAASDRLNFARSSLLREVMLRHGDGDTALWATAFGWNAGGDGVLPTVPAEQQAGYTAEALALAPRRQPWLGPLLWTGRFAPTDATWQALVAASASLPTLPPGRLSPDHPAIWYTGWRSTGDGADPSQDGDSIEFSFDGTGVALEVQGGPYWGYLMATVDGEPANRLPQDEAGAAYLVLHDPAAASRVIPLATGLPSGLHNVRLVSTGGWGQWPLRAVVVVAETPPPSGLGWLLLALALAGTLAWAAAFLIARRRAGREEAAPPPSSSAPAATPAWGRPTIPAALLFGLAALLAVAYHLTGSGLLNFAILGLFGLLFLLDPGIAPPLIAASLPFWQRTQPVLRWEFALFEALAWIAVLAWAGRAMLGWMTNGAFPASAFRRSPANAAPGNRHVGTIASRGIGNWLDITTIALAGSGLLAALFASEQGVAWREFRIVFLFGLVFYLLITRGAVALRRPTIAPLVAGLLAGAAIASLAGLWQLVSGQGRVDVEGVSRIAAFYGSPNNLALILDRAVPLALALALFGAWGSSGRGRVVRALLLAVALTCLVAAVATFSKGAVLLGLPVGIAVVLIGGAWRGRRRWPLWLLLGLVVVAAGGLLVLFRTPRFADLFNFEAGTSFFRLKLWQGAWNMALDHPVLGVGPDNFLYAYRTRYVLPSGWQELNLSHPHNLVLDLWTRLGLVGLVAGIAALAAAFLAGWRLFGRRLPSSAGRADRWPLALGLLAGLAASVAHGLIDNSLFLPDLMGWFVAATGIFWLMLRRVED